MKRVLVFGISVLLAACQEAAGPVIDGRPLSYWKKEAEQVSMFSFWNSDKDERRRIAFGKLAEAGEPAVPVLMELLRQNEAPVSSNAFNVLANLGPRARSAEPELRAMLRDKRPQVRRNAAWLLNTIEGRNPARAQLIRR